jgi:hypothetical protein
MQSAALVRWLHCGRSNQLQKRTVTILLVLRALIPEVVVVVNPLPLNILDKLLIRLIPGGPVLAPPKKKLVCCNNRWL